MKSIPSSSTTSFFPVLSCVALVLMALGTGTAQAASANWIGGGSDALWSNAANWSASPVPQAPDATKFARFKVVINP